MGGLKGGRGWGVWGGGSGGFFEKKRKKRIGRRKG